MIVVALLAASLVSCDSAAQASRDVVATRLVTRTVVSVADLTRIEVRDTMSGARFVVLTDSVSFGTATRSIPILSGFYHQIACYTSLPVSDIAWGAVAFVADPAYRSPLTALETRWLVVTDARGDFTATGREFFYVGLPHEQVHATQPRVLRLPRWYAEGQAEWIGLRVTATWNPEAARHRTSQHSAALKWLGNQPVELRAWQGPRVRPEAVRGQTPPYRFGPEDIISDESRTPARYAASRNLFESVYDTAGEERMLAWMRTVRDATPPISDTRVIELAIERAGIDLVPLLNRVP
jgi:hypothetical protein